MAKIVRRAPLRCQHCGGAIRRPGLTVKYCSIVCRGAAIKGKPLAPEIVAARAVPKGEAHYRWHGDSVSVRGGRNRALRAFVGIGPCVRCGAKKAERHHKDGDTANNAADNIEVLCRRCHMAADGRLEMARAATMARNAARRAAASD